MNTSSLSSVRRPPRAVFIRNFPGRRWLDRQTRTRSAPHLDLGAFLELGVWTLEL